MSRRCGKPTDACWQTCARTPSARARSNQPCITSFKVTASYWPGLFVCYTRPDSPRTNNDLEHLFGSAWYHERRSSGRKVPAPMFLTRGRVRLITATCQHHAFSSTDLQPNNLMEWRCLRQQVY